ncbi:MAG TPA: arsenate reductase family protein [Candidatus Fimivivens faecavium]|nr:arsenate reductase family protein [Candidatus Fimivivens faecavium]
MSVVFLHYPKCGACRKAKRWLEEHGVEYTPREIHTDRPSAEELAAYAKAAGLPARKLVNTSGRVYRELGLKDRISSMTEEELFALLSTDGMLVKRPVLAGAGFALVGFRPDEWERRLAP